MLRSASTVTVIDFEMLHGFTWIRELILMNSVNVTLLIVQLCTPLPRFGMSQKTVSNFIYVCILAEQNNLEQKVLTVHQVLSIIYCLSSQPSYANLMQCCYSSKSGGPFKGIQISCSVALQFLG